jgi:retron-type reverse transcriptase
LSVYAFNLHLERNLTYLVQALKNQSYKADSLLRVDIPKAEGGYRMLLIPTVADRVVQAATLEVLQSVFDAEYERCSFAYRPGLSHRDAIEEVEWLYQDGFRWVVEADIARFFDEVNHDLLMERFFELVPEEALKNLVRQWITAPARFRGKKQSRTRGIPHGRHFGIAQAPTQSRKNRRDPLRPGLYFSPRRS